ACGAEDESLAKAAAEQGHQADLHSRAAGVVEIGIGPLQRRPHAGPAWMDEAKHWNSRVETIRLVNPYRFPLRSILLAIIRNDHTHIMAPARQRPTKQSLLNRFAADVMLSVFRRQGREIVEPDEADLQLEALRDAQQITTAAPNPETPSPAPLAPRSIFRRAVCSAISPLDQARGVPDI